MNRIVLLMAMMSEAKPLIDAIGLEESKASVHPPFPFRTFGGRIDTSEIYLTTSGTDALNNVDNVGTVPAALMGAFSIDLYRPDLVINAGTAGGIAEAGCAIGEVYLSGGLFSFHDRRIPIPGFEEYGRGGYPSFDTTKLAKQLGMKMGTVSTGDSLDMVERDMELILQNEAVIKDMEAAAIAWTCRQFEVPMFAIKAITDLIDEPDPTPKQFLLNLNLAAGQLQKSTIRVLETLAKSEIVNSEK